jgi:hypothetical protein
MYNFGAGRARIIPSQGGQPYELGVVQSATLDLKVDLKELRGSYRYPLAVADGKGTASGKVSFMEFWPSTLAALLGGTLQTNTQQVAVAEPQTVPATTAFTVTLNNATTLVAGSEIVTVNVGGSLVYYSRVTSGPVAATTSAPTIGTYSITAGVLTFAAADASRNVFITYSYTPATSGNVGVAIQQVGINTATTFQLTLMGISAKNPTTNGAQQLLVQLNACLAPSLTMNVKLDDFTDLSLDYQAYIDGNGNLGTIFLVNPTS